MSDDSPDRPEQDVPPARRPSPGASAASRARRIGGRPVPSAAPQQSAGEVRGDQPAPPPPVAEPVRLEKPPAEPGRSAPAAVRWVPAGVLGVAALALVALVVAFSHGVYWDKASAPAPAASSAANAGPANRVQEQVLAAGKQCIATLNTYDYRKLDQALTKGLACTTGTFTTDYRTAFTREIKARAPALKAVQTAQVNRAGIASVSPDGKQWVLLIYGQLQITNTSTKKGSPRIDIFGAVVTMDKVGSQWLVGKVDTDAGSGLGS